MNDTLWRYGFNDIIEFKSSGNMNAKEVEKKGVNGKSNYLKVYKIIFKIFKKHKYLKM